MTTPIMKNHPLTYDNDDVWMKVLAVIINDRVFKVGGIDSITGNTIEHIECMCVDEGIIFTIIYQSPTHGMAVEFQHIGAYTIMYGA